jgi:sialate O-acetylesterase
MTGTLTSFVAFVGLFFAVPAAFSDTETTAWNGATSDWNLNSNWEANQLPDSTHSALFDSTFVKHPQLTGSGTAQGLYLTSGATQDVTITGDSSQRALAIIGNSTLGGQIDAAIVLDDSANHSLTLGNANDSLIVSLSSDSGFYVNNAGTLTVQGSSNFSLNDHALTLGGTNASGRIVLAKSTVGAGSLLINTAGSVTLSGANGHTGGTTLAAGTLNLNSNKAVGSVGSTFTINGGTLDNTTGAAISLSENNPIVIGGDFIFRGGPGATHDLGLGAGMVALGPATRTVTVNAGTLTLGGNVTGNGLVKGGAGTLALGGGAVIGSVTISSGTLAVNGSLAAGTIQVSGGSLRCAGLMSGSVIVGPGGSLVLDGSFTGGSIQMNGGTLSGSGHISGSLTLGTSTTTTMQLWGNGATTLRGASALTYGGNLVVNNNGATLTAGSSFKLFDAATYSGSFASTTLPALAPGLMWYLFDLTTCGTIRVVPLWSVAAIFADNMVLQRGVLVPVWGSAEPGQPVTVTFGGQTKTATAGPDRKWMVHLDAMAANANPQQLTITIPGVTTVVYSNILVGDVWLASGQSNMEYTVNGVADADAEKAAAVYPLIRSMRVMTQGAIAPAWDIGFDRVWTACSPATVPSWSAVAYFFARSVFENTHVPIGIVESYYGGSMAEHWASLDALKAIPELKTHAESQIELYYHGWVAVYRTPAGLFNSMISPLIPFALRGALWYQGESNTADPMRYRVSLPTLIQDWRSRWQLADFPFYIVQLPNFSDDRWPSLREAQLLTLQTATNTGLAVTIDVGDPNSIHPADKQDVGQRLAYLALNRNHGFAGVVPSGPIFRRYTIEGNQIRAFFDHAEGGLMTGVKNAAAPLSPVQEQIGVGPGWFEIAGADGTYYAASATISGSTVLVSSPSVPNPLLVRYAWSPNPLGNNLYNRAGIPASPFRIAAQTYTIPEMSFQQKAGMIQLDCAVPNNVTGWVEVTDNLAGQSWVPLDVPQTGTGAIQSVAEMITGDTRRFYRWRFAP